MLIDPRVVDDRARAGEALARLEQALADGGWLTPLDPGDLTLGDGELLYAQLPLHVRCLCRVRRSGTRMPVIAGTGLGWWISACAAWISRRHRQSRDTEAAVRWVDLGVRVVFLTNCRALFADRGHWVSCLPASTAGAWIDTAGRSLRFAGAWVGCADSIRRRQMV